MSPTPHNSKPFHGRPGRDRDDARGDGGQTYVNTGVDKMPAPSSVKVPPSQKSPYPGGARRVG